MTIEQTVDFLYEVPKFTTKNSIDHTKLFMERLGNPCLDRKVIHIAGSNGKGSVCNFLYHMLMEGGKSVGMFISPHLVDIRERFQVNGDLCAEEIYLDAFLRVQHTVTEMVNDGLAHPTFFELLFGIGMLVFEKSDVEYIILETGLGGRLDATNSYPTPAMSVITSISLEHTEYLGDTIAEIAGEKAGIIKSGVPVIYDAMEPEASKVIQQIAAEHKCPRYAVSDKNYKIIKIKNNFLDFCYNSDYDSESEWISGPCRKADLESQVWSIPFSAIYQAQNASIAITAMGILGVLTAEEMWKGMRHAFWPGRMQEIQPAVYLDGAHNPSGIKAFVESVQRLIEDDTEKPLLLFSMVKEKDYRTAIELLTQQIEWEAVAVTRIPDDRGLSYEQLQELFCQDTENPVLGFEDYKEAFETMAERKKPGQTLFCTGSLYFAGALLGLL